MLNCIDPQKQSDVDERHAIALRIQANSKEARTGKLRAFSQTLLSFTALWNKWRAALQMFCKRKISEWTNRASPSFVIAKFLWLHHIIGTIWSCSSTIGFIKYISGTVNEFNSFLFTQQWLFKQLTSFPPFSAVEKMFSSHFQLFCLYLCKVALKGF